MSSESKNDKTRFVHVSTAHKQIGDSAPVNPPIMRASTVLYRNTTAAADVRRRSDAGEPVLRTVSVPAGGVIVGLLAAIIVPVRSVSYGMIPGVLASGAHLR